METQLLQQKESLEKLNESLTINSIQSLSSVTDVHEKINELTADWENDLINASFDSTLKGLKGKKNLVFLKFWKSTKFCIELVEKFIASLQDASNKEDSFEIDTNGIAGFIQDTQAWLINHLSNSSFPLLKNCLDVSNTETVARVQTGLKIAFKRIADRFKASIVASFEVGRS